MRGGLDYGFRQAITQGLIKGPRLFLSVSMLTQTGGHGDKRGIARHENVPRNSIGIYPEICDGPDAVRKSAREMLRRGADQIKVMADGGVASPTDRPGHWQYTVEELKAAVATAEAAGTYSFVLLLHSPRCLQRGFALNSLDSAWIDVIEISYIEI
jgi:imidazolonepropionase-like amidohydrolase